MATTDATPLRAGNTLTVTQTVTPVLDTNAYAALDSLHTDPLKLPGMARMNGGSGVITRFTVVDAADQGVALVVHLFTADPTNTTATANAALAVHDTDALTYIGSIASGAYEDLNLNRVATNANVRLAYQCAATDDSLYVLSQSLGAPTYAASSLRFVFQADLD